MKNNQSPNFPETNRKVVPGRFVPPLKRTHLKSKSVFPSGGTNKKAFPVFGRKILLTIIVSFALLQLLFSCKEEKKRFITEEQLKNQVSQQSAVNEQKLTQLKQFGVDDRSGISVDFFFVTDDSSKASGLMNELLQLNYHVNQVHPSDNNQDLWIASGSSSRLNVKAITSWTDSISRLGFRYDCSFQGWNPVTE